MISNGFTLFDKVIERERTNICNIVRKNREILLNVIFPYIYTPKNISFIDRYQVIHIVRKNREILLNVIFPYIYTLKNICFIDRWRTTNIINIVREMIKYCYTFVILFMIKYEWTSWSYHKNIINWKAKNKKDKI